MALGKGIQLKPADFAAMMEMLPHGYMVALHNFEVEAGREAEEHFQSSFVDKSFNGKSWAGWQNGFVGRGELMHETGTLMNSIKACEPVKRGANVDLIKVHTDPRDFHNARRNKGLCYAGVHNNLDSIKNKPPRGPKVQRQFMGYSPKLEKKIQEMGYEMLQRLFSFK